MHQSIQYFNNLERAKEEINLIPIELDKWVIPYHALTLLIWKAHMNIQYVTDKGLVSNCYWSCCG